MSFLLVVVKNVWLVREKVFVCLLLQINYVIIHVKT